MPLYEYECAACGQRFELIRKFSDPPIDSCALCAKGPVTRLQSAPAIQFKGSGFYITDYVRQGADAAKPETSPGEKSKSTKADTPSDGGQKSDVKTTTESKADTSAGSAVPTPTPASSTSPTSPKE